MSKKKDMTTEQTEVKENVDNIETTEQTEGASEPEVQEEAKKDKSKYKLNIEVAFTDKYTDEDYKIGDVITVDKKRFDELMNDPRKLVSENK